MTVKLRRRKQRGPCKDCPFRTDSMFAKCGLRRAGEIAETLSRDSGDFKCHKTTDETGDGTNLGCIGAYKVLLKEGRVNQLMRIQHRLGLLDLDAVEAHPAPVYPDLQTWVKVMHDADGGAS